MVINYRGRYGEEVDDAASTAFTILPWGGGPFRYSWCRELRPTSKELRSVCVILALLVTILTLKLVY